MHIQIILSGNKTLRITKGHNSIVNLQKFLYNNSNLDLVNTSAYAKLGQRKFWQ